MPVQVIRTAGADEAAQCVGTQCRWWALRAIGQELSAFIYVVARLPVSSPASVAFAVVKPDLVETGCLCVAVVFSLS